MIPPRLARAARIGSVLVLAMSAWSCWLGESALEPDRSLAQLSLVPVIEGLAAVGLADVTTLDITVRRLDGTVVFEETREVTEGQVTISASISYEPPSEVFSVEISLRDGEGGLVYTGQVDVTVGDDDAGEPVTVPVTYVGPGSDATAVEIDPSEATIQVGESFTFTAQGLRSDGSVTPGLPIGWESLDPAVAIVLDAASGRVQALEPGRVQITATSVPLATGRPSDVAVLNVLAQPTFSIGDVTVTEGDAGTVAAVFDVTLSGAANQPVTVDFATVDGTAVAPDDYQARSGTLTFDPGVTTRQVTVTVNGDLVDEGTSEGFTVELSGASGATITDGTGAGTILDDDDGAPPPVVPTMSIADVTVTEGDVGSVEAVFEVTLSEATSETVTVDFATADGTAVAPDDYLSTSGTLTFDPGVTTQQVTVTANGDLIDEGTSETFSVELSGPSGATIGKGTGEGEITDDDSSALSIDGVEVTEGDAGTTDAVFSVTLSNPSGQTVTVDYQTVDGSATAGSDYETNADQLTFAPGVVSATITIVVLGDVIDEQDETFDVTLSNPSNATISNGSARGTITDDDSSALSIDDVTVLEGDAGTTNAVFTVTLSNPSSQAVTVDYQTANGSATAGSDYQTDADQLTFAPGVVSATITIVVLGDVIDEPDETFDVTLSNPSNATISDASGTGTITDDDPQPSLSIDDVTVTEGSGGGFGNAVFTVTLSNPSSQTVTVDYQTANGSATAGDCVEVAGDYCGDSGTVTFGPGILSRPITVLVFRDDFDESDETFSVNLSNASNASIGDGSGTGTILDDDPQPSLSIDDVTITEGTGGGFGNAVFTVTLSNPSSQTVTVDYQTANGSATAGDCVEVAGDYCGDSGTVTFGPGILSRPITVLVFRDDFDESNETFLVNLSNASSASISDASGTGTIIDDDEATLSISDQTVSEGNSGTTNAVFNVTLSSPSAQTVTVSYETFDGTAFEGGDPNVGFAGFDYVGTSGTLTFVPGDMSETVIVQIKGDNVEEFDDTFRVDLSNPSNASIQDGSGLGTINNDDPPVELSVNDVSLVEGDSGSKFMEFLLIKTGSSVKSNSVLVQTQDGTATAGLDYQGVSFTGNVNVQDGAEFFVVEIFGDNLVESDETFTVALSNPVNATIGDFGTGTILNDDAPGFGTIQGMVVDASTLQPLQGVQVSVQGTGIGGLTNASGSYLLLNVPTGQQVVLAQQIGYFTGSENATVLSGQTVVVDFALDEISALSVGAESVRIEPDDEGITRVESFALRISPSPADGSIRSFSGIDCDPDQPLGSGPCASTLRSGENVVLRASPDPGFTVEAWSGCDRVAGGTECHVQMTGDRTVSVSFRPLAR